MEATVTGLWLLTSSWITARSIIRYMGSCRYDYQYLGVDHEEHYFFYPLEREHNIVLVDSPWLTYGKRHLTSRRPSQIGMKEGWQGLKEHQ